MIDFFAYKKGYWYPHMKPRDISIWERFIDKYPDRYDKVQYDFAIGDVPQFIANASSPEGQKMAELYKLKIDVLGYTADRLDLIEIKPSATAASIGQVLGYKQIYERDEKPTLPVNPIVLTDELKVNMDFLAQQAGVQIIIV